jgi:hypothetical protein
MNMKVLLPLQLMGAAAIDNLNTPSLNSLISGLSVVTLIVPLIFSLPLYAVACLLGHIAALETRLESPTGL